MITFGSQSVGAGAGGGHRCTQITMVKFADLIQHHYDTTSQQAGEVVRVRLVHQRV